MNTPNCTKCGATLSPGAQFCELCGTAVKPDNRSLSVRLQEDLGAEYVVMGELGAGGFAKVYLVRESATGRHLAVKVMREALLVSEAVVSRFTREINCASRLDHPNIVPVAFSKERNDLCYYAMPRVNGKTLKKHIEEATRLSIDESVRILRQLAEGLAYAHERGVVHRDIKPSNLMLGHDGSVQILDFGIAKALSHKGSRLTISGELLGSPEYMSPEQATGSKTVNSRTDIYSWGVVGYEMLTGQPPFSGNSIQELLHKHVAATVPPLQSIRPDVPSHVQRVLQRCLEKESRKRWPNIRVAANALLC